MEKSWVEFTPPLQLNPGDVHIWMARLDQNFSIVTYLAKLLSESERYKANRFHFEHDQQRYIVAHAFLRVLLGAYTNMRPTEIAFSVGTYGKPFLVSQSHVPDVYFNFSHSCEVALVALTYDCEVGVDIEYIQPLDDADLIARQFFSPLEQTMLSALPIIQKQQAFYACWSRKEAIIKALGLGLAMPLDTFSVSLDPHEPARLIFLQENLSEQQHWELYDLPSMPHYATSLALQGNDKKLIYNIWNPD